MREAERKLYNRAALAAYKTLLAQAKGRSSPEIVEAAYEAADLFFWGRYDRILTRYEADKALKRVLELDGNQGRGLDFTVSRYKGMSEPLRAYAEDRMGARRTSGQIAIDRFLEKQRTVA